MLFYHNNRKVTKTQGGGEGGSTATQLIFRVNYISLQEVEACLMTSTCQPSPSNTCLPEFKPRLSTVASAFYPPSHPSRGPECFLLEVNSEMLPRP